jgi:hypothetical protein
VFVDEALAELDAMAKDGAPPLRSRPNPPLAGAALRKAVMAIWCVCFCGVQWQAINVSPALFLRNRWHVSRCRPANTLSRGADSFSAPATVQLVYAAAFGALNEGFANQEKHAR